MKAQTLKRALEGIKQIRTKREWKKGYTIDKMSDNHINNSIVFLTKRQKDYTECKLGPYMWNGLNSTEWIEIFRDELKYRVKNNIVISDNSGFDDEAYYMHNNW